MLRTEGFLQSSPKLSLTHWFSRVGGVSLCNTSIGIFAENDTVQHVLNLSFLDISVGKPLELFISPELSSEPFTVGDIED